MAKVFENTDQTCIKSPATKSILFLIRFLKQEHIQLRI